MKKSIALVILMAFVSVGRVSAWGRLGHEVVIAIAQRHLTDKTKENISEYISYDLKQDAIWMDSHRKDKAIAITTHWHSCYFDDNMAHLQSSVFKLSKDLIDSIHEEGIVAYTS